MVCLWFTWYYRYSGLKKTQHRLYTRVRQKTPNPVIKHVERETGFSFSTVSHSFFLSFLLFIFIIHYISVCGQTVSHSYQLSAFWLDISECTSAPKQCHLNSCIHTHAQTKTHKIQNLGLHAKYGLAKYYAHYYDYRKQRQGS